MVKHRRLKNSDLATNCKARLTNERTGHETRLLRMVAERAEKRSFVSLPLDARDRVSTNAAVLFNYRDTCVLGRCLRAVYSMLIAQANLSRASDKRQSPVPE